MALLPLLFENYVRPTRLLDQQFGLCLDPEDLLAPVLDPGHVLGHFRSPVGYIRPWRTALSQRDVGSTLAIDKDTFKANLDVQQFKPEEITVKVTGNNTITIEGKHEEKQDDHGFISRQFVRRYVLPKDCDINKIESKLSSDGVLTITAPRNKPEEAENKSIPITQTGQPAKIEQKKEEKVEKKVYANIPSLKMALLPLLFENYVRPTRLLDQQFGLCLDPEDLLAPVLDPGHVLGHFRSPVGYIRPWRTALSQRDVGSTLAIDKDTFKANLDVQQFKPEEITVKVTGNNTITIEGKHEEKQDEHGFISRQFVRSYVLPKDCDINKIESKLSSDGVLTITAPRNKPEETENKSIPITQTGQPAKIEQKKEGKVEKKE
ncbi:uncharacterized protein LOC123310887 [Coccinella septempunctata]|uniref:uncharacterized protein LOC123310887 n=1 Tax=Coccinella septempunctata TaxID=41139 RepID=UPI001D083680|nr:uncharacterized protein LOC123310887 [Coccinella septempunctata]